MKKPLSIFVFLLTAAGFLQADVVNGSLDIAQIFDASTINVADDVDDGWSAYASTEYDLSYNDIWSTGLMTQPGYWFGQIYTDNYSTYGTGSLSFDVSVVGTRDNAMFEYAVYGTDSTDSSSTAFALNTDGSPLETGTAWTLLDSGMVETRTVNGYEQALNLAASYKYLAVRFRFSGTVGGDTAVDNISVVPEPAAIGLLALGGILTLVISRFRRRSQ